MNFRRWAMPCGVMIGMALGFWNVHVDAQQVPSNVNAQNMERYIVDTCARLRAAGGQSSSSSNSSGSLAAADPTRSTALAAVSPAALSISQSDLLTRCTNIAIA